MMQQKSIWKLKDSLGHWEIWGTLLVYDHRFHIKFERLCYQDFGYQKLRENNRMHK